MESVRSRPLFSMAVMSSAAWVTGRYPEPTANWMLFSGWVNHLRNVTQAASSSGVLLVTTMPAPCWTATSSLPANEGLGSTFRLISWLSVSLTCTCLGKKVALELEPT